jgi:hypothetical protein
LIARLQRPERRHEHVPRHISHRRAIDCGYHCAENYANVKR